MASGAKLYPKVVTLQGSKAAHILNLKALSGLPPSQSWGNFFLKAFFTQFLFCASFKLHTLNTWFLISDNLWSIVSTSQVRKHKEPDLLKAMLQEAESGLEPDLLSWEAHTFFTATLPP